MNTIGRQPGCGSSVLAVAVMGALAILLGLQFRANMTVDSSPARAGSVPVDSLSCGELRARYDRLATIHPGTPLERALEVAGLDWPRDTSRGEGARR